MKTLTTIENEVDWIEYLKRSTRLAEEKMRTANFPCCIITQKDEMETANEDIFSARDKMVLKSSKMESRSQQSCGKTRKEMGRRHQETKGNDLKNNDTWMRVAKDQTK